MKFCLVNAQKPQSNPTQIVIPSMIFCYIKVFALL